MNPGFLAPVLLAVAANLLGHVIKLYQEKRGAERKLKEAEEGKFRAALSSDSLNDLGGYLDRAIGSFLVTEYAHKHEVRERVNTFLARLEQYVGNTAEVPKGTAAPESTEADRLPVSSELKEVETRLQEGRPWDALATLRRTIERKLIALAKQSEVEPPAKPGVGRFLHLLRQQDLIPSDAASSLRYAIDVANRGVHGLDVRTEEAFEALRHARRAFSIIEHRSQVRRSDEL